jgi:hypothetical protein
MAVWIECPTCRLKHTARPDWICPRCRQPLAGGAPPAPPPGGFAPASSTFNVGRLITETFSIWLKNAGWVIPLVLLFNAPVAVAMFRAYARFPSDPAGQQLLRSSAFWAAMVINLLINPLELFAVVRAATRRLRGDAVTLGDLVGATARAYFPALALWILVLLAGLATGCTVYFPFMLLTAWSASLPAMDEEGLGPIQALRRSWQLTRGHRWQVFAGLLVVALIVRTASFVLGAVLTVGVVGMPGLTRGVGVGGQGLGAAQALSTLVESVGSSLVTTATAVAYHQLRQVLEGPAVAHLRRVFE